MVQISWTEQSKKDLFEIFEYISIDSKTYAQRQIVRIKASTKVLIAHPELGNVVPELQDPRYRQLIEGNYRIIYKILDIDRVDILTIHHAARDLGRRRIQ